MFDNEYLLYRAIFFQPLQKLKLYKVNSNLLEKLFTVARKIWSKMDIKRFSQIFKKLLKLNKNRFS